MYHNHDFLTFLRLLFFDFDLLLVVILCDPLFGVLLLLLIPLLYFFPYSIVRAIVFVLRILFFESLFLDDAERFLEDDLLDADFPLLFCELLFVLLLDLLLDLD